MECYLGRDESSQNLNYLDDLELRPVGAGDLRPLHKLYNECFSVAGRGPREEFGYWRSLFTSPRVVARSVWFKASRVGAVAIFKEGGELELTYWLSSAVRGRRVGTRAVGNFLQSEKRRPVLARVREGNLASSRLLEGHGFRFVERNEIYCDYREQYYQELLYRLTD